MLLNSQKYICFLFGQALSDFSNLRKSVRWYILIQFVCYLHALSYNLLGLRADPKMYKHRQSEKIKQTQNFKKINSRILKVLISLNP